MKVSQIAINAADPAGVKVLEIYAFNPPLFAVYRTERRVVVQYADDPRTAADQRLSLSRLSPLRSDINGLIDGWRSSSDPAKRAKANRYDLRVGLALSDALQAGPDNAVVDLQNIKTEIHDERTSWARFLYLIAAFATAAGAIALIALATSPAMRWFVSDWPGDTANVWLAAGAGAVGSMFSIAVNIRKRTVLTDLSMRDNVADAILRVIIGVISGAVLLDLLQSNVVALNIGVGSAPKALAEGVPGTHGWAFVVLVGFIAGFLEQLVPDLLASAAVAAAKSGAASNPSLTKVDAPNKAPGPLLGAVPAGTEAPSAPKTLGSIHDEDADGCAGEFDLPPGEATPDAALPPAVGGVA